MRNEKRNGNPAVLINKIAICDFGWLVDAVRRGLKMKRGEGDAAGR